MPVFGHGPPDMTCHDQQSMDIRRDLLKRDSQIALYRQLKDWVVGEIARGTWATGSLLPSERALGTELGVSRITVRQALRELVQEGVLESVPGKGFFVAARPSHALHGILSLTALAAERGLTVSNRILSARRVPASLELARRLGADVGTALLHIARLRLLDGVAVTIQRLWLPEALCPGLLDEDLEIASIPSLLSGTFGIELEGAEADDRRSASRCRRATTARARNRCFRANGGSTDAGPRRRGRGARAFGARSEPFSREPGAGTTRRHPRPSRLGWGSVRPDDHAWRRGTLTIIAGPGRHQLSPPAIRETEMAARTSPTRRTAPRRSPATATASPTVTTGNRDVTTAATASAPACTARR